jgi:hypothetical protein
MGIFDTLANGASQAVNNIQSAATGLANDITSGNIGAAASKLGSALNNLSNPSALISSIRSMNLPGSGGAAFAATRVSFAGPGNTDDWRVRIGIPNNFFAKSPVLAPLMNSNGLVFPYTPTISINSSAGYDDIALTHQNYQFLAYQNSRVNDFQISGSFYCETADQAQYWIAVVHFLRSATKMYTGDSGEFSGSPPPILTLNGYGDFVFKNVPVVVKSFSVELPADTNYIGTTVGQATFSGAGNPMGGGGGGGTLSTLAGVAGAFGASGAAKILGAAANVSNAVNNVTNFINGVAGAGATSASTHVPTKSTVSITLQPIYSRESVRQFSLQKFVNGDYMNGSGGYV